MSVCMYVCKLSCLGLDAYSGRHAGSGPGVLCQALLRAKSGSHHLSAASEGVELDGQVRVAPYCSACGSPTNQGSGCSTRNAHCHCQAQAVHVMYSTCHVCACPVRHVRCRNGPCCSK